MLLRKEVIQPHLPVRLPCYDFVPIADPAFDGSLPQGVGPPASGVTDFRDVTGGVYKARERIHRSVADRSEEHTSELQSRQYLVCRLLLEKKKKKKQYAR